LIWRAPLFDAVCDAVELIERRQATEWRQRRELMKKPENTPGVVAMRSRASDMVKFWYARTTHAS